MSYSPFSKVNLEEPEQRSLDLPEDDQFSAASHFWSRDELNALSLAWATRRPLLIRGEAGCGKSQIARAAAVVLGGSEAKPLVEVLNGHSEAQDLLFRYDQLKRLADAELKDLDKSDERYLRKGVLWRAFEHECPGLQVVLIDEIDKADAELPNSLLEAFGSRSFWARLPSRDRHVKLEKDEFPLVVITTNAERELPVPFVRRCVVLWSGPDHLEEVEFKKWLKDRGNSHKFQVCDKVAESLREMIWEDRAKARALIEGRVGLAEYIDLLSAMQRLTVPSGVKLCELSDAERRRIYREQKGLAKELSQFALDKYEDNRKNRADPSEDIAANGAN